MNYKQILIVFTWFLLSFGCYAENCIPNQTDLSTIYQELKDNNPGQPASYIPELSKVNPSLFAISIATVDGNIVSIGDSKTLFSLQSISKIFIYAMALKDNGEKNLFDNVGLEATGQAFNSLQSIENNVEHNPFVNVGAIQTTSLIKGKNSQDKWNRELNFLYHLGIVKPVLSKEIYASESATNQRNQAIGQLLKSKERINGDPQEIVARYTKACSLMVNAEDLAVMGATLANHGINPITHEQVLSAKYARDVISEMVINGIYEKSGSWFVIVGLPAKSGVSGAILAIIPHKMAIAVYSPAIDKSGTSIRGQKVLEQLSKIWDLHLLTFDSGPQICHVPRDLR